MLKNRIIAEIVYLLIDILSIPFVLLSANLLLIVRIIGFKKLKISKQVLLLVGIMPIRRSYYEPLFDKRDLTSPLSRDRILPGIDWNIKDQISFLDNFHYSNELLDISDSYKDDLTFHFNNGAFETGDAEYLYNIIRFIKPKNFIEIGGGNSTKIAAMAIKKNMEENSEFSCDYICIEPFNMPWLEKLDIFLIREKIENVNKELFKKLGNNDILFIDSSHMIRPQGDVLFEYLELLPILNQGVIVHIHDIFSPKDYHEEWVIDEIRFWNEQYLLEAFLTSNKEWKIIGALNFLFHNHFEDLKKICFKLSKSSAPSSFYIKKIR